MWPLLHKKISTVVPLSDEEYKQVESAFSYRKYRKKQYILQEGDICRHEIFILKGCTRTYNINEDGQENIIQFGIEGWWVGNRESCTQETASEYNIDCLEDTEVLMISRSDLYKLYEMIPAIERYFRILLRNALFAFQHRVLMLMNKPAAERYQDFINSYPEIAERVPDHQVASYLGMTPQSLSRIRRQYASKKS